MCPKMPKKKLSVWPKSLSLNRYTKTAISRDTLLRWLPLVAVLLVATVSFFYGWYGDTSKPQSGAGWADQGTYALTASRIAGGENLLPQDLHFAVGYPILGAIGSVVSGQDPFMIVSLALLLASVTFCFLAARHLFGTPWALAFCALLFYWDGVARTFHFASELFSVPWNNQVLFFAFSFFLWLLATRASKKPSNKLVALAGLVSGLSFVVREESILFVAPMLAIFLLITKSQWRQWLIGFALIGVCFLPQVGAKFAVFESLTESGHDYGYSETLSKYLDPQRFYENVDGVIVDSGYPDAPKSPTVSRPALLQVAPWLWLSLIGVIIMLFSKRYSIGLKVFVIVSLFLMFFYLSGINMSVHKLAFHCLRYISPGFIVLNLAVIVVLREIVTRRQSLAFYKSAIINGMRSVKKYLSNEQWGSGTWRAIGMLPVFIPVFLAVFGVVAVSLLVVGRLDNVLVWPIGGALSLLSLYMVWKRYRGVDRPGSLSEQRVFDVLVVVGVALWVGINAFYTSQSVFVYRDPAIYTVTAERIKNNSNLTVETTNVFGDQQQLTSESAGFEKSTLNENELFAQGQHLLPTLLGLFGRVFGTNLMMHAAPIFGGAALLAIYGFARLIVKPRWATFVVIALSLSLPFLYFSRDTYTEPLAATFTFGALSLIWAAQKNKSPWLWLIAGVVVGAGTLTRVDAYITIGALAVFLAIMLSIINRKKDGAEQLKGVLAFAIAVVAVAVIGWLDLTLLASGYYRNLEPRFFQMIAAVGAAVFAGIVWVILYWKTKVFSKTLDKKTKSWRGTAALIAILVVAGLLISRPLWLESHHKINIPLVGGLQAAAGNPEEPTRDYAENTATWVAWYIGPLLALSGVAGIAIAAKRTMGDKRLLLLPALLVVIGTTLVFFIRPSITPDQVWASRRLMPVIMPGIAIFGVLALQRLSELKFMDKKLSQQLWGLALVAVLLSPLVFSYPFLRTQAYTPQLAQINDICQSLPEKSAIIWVGTMARVGTQTSVSFCDTPSVGVVPGEQLQDVDLASAAESAIKNGYQPIIGSDQDSVEEFPAGTELSLVSSIRYEVLPNSLYTPPREVIVKDRSVFMGRILPSGEIAPLEE